jgi:two-component system OmpR family response regulator
MSKYITIIEDDKDTLQSLKLLFESYDYSVLGFSSPNEYLNDENPPGKGIFLIDWNLPGMVGTEVVRILRTRDKVSPIFMMSASKADDLILEALKTGVDHFFKKPFNVDELLVRLNNAYFKIDHLKENLMNIGVKLLPEASTVIKDGIPLALTTREFLIFQYLYLHKGPISREELLKCFDPDMLKGNRNIDVHVHSLRKKLNQVKMAIDTVWGVGYKLSCLKSQ